MDSLRRLQLESLPTDAPPRTLSIVTSPASDSEIRGLREWLRNERRLGVPHWDTPVADAPPAVSAPPTASPAATPRRSPAARVPGSPPAPSGAEHRAESRPAAARPPQPTAPLPRAAATLPLPLAHGALDADLPPFCDRELSAADADAALAAIDESFVRVCTRCGLHAGRNRTVFGVGHARPELVFVGEAPGADEDAQGVPFVGKAGQLLTKMIEAGMRLKRDQVYIANVAKCRPPGNRTPLPTEIAACSPYLLRQLAILRPKVIVTLGAPASQTLLQTNTPIGKLRGQFHDFPPPAWSQYPLAPCRLMPTFHPSYLLRCPWEKAKAWEDLKQVMRLLGLPIEPAPA